MQNLSVCPREKGFFPVSYQVSTQDIWINDICSVTDKPRIRMWPWSSIIHSYHMVNITRTKTISLFNAKIREIRFSFDIVDTEKCTSLIFSKWYFLTFSGRQWNITLIKNLIFTSILKSIFMCLVHFRLDFDILSEPFIEHLLLILLNLNHILLFTH